MNQPLRKPNQRTNPEDQEWIEVVIERCAWLLTAIGKALPVALLIDLCLFAYH